MTQFDNTNKGGGWITTSKKGVQYINMKVNIDGVEHKLAVFKNAKKNSPKQPDYNVVVSKPQNLNPSQVANSFDNTPDDGVPF